MNIYNDNNNDSVSILSQLDQTGVWRGGGGQEGFPKPVFMVKVVACLSASGMLTYKGCDYSIYKTRDSLSRLNLWELCVWGGGGGGGGGAGYVWYWSKVVSVTAKQYILQKALQQLKIHT